MRIIKLIRNATLALALTSAATTTVAQAAEEASSISRGGRLYDKFWVETKADAPKTPHAAYPDKAGKYAQDSSWRCKECHGWDYKGKDGAYAKGGHATGIIGITGAAGKDPAAIVAILRNQTHGYDEQKLSAKDAQDLALFVSKGQIDMSQHIDYAAKKPKGDAAKGEGYFNTLCAGCHGTDGKKITNAPPLGSLQNPQEMLHKVLNGQPNQPMPSLRLLAPQIAVDLVSHMMTLPQQ